MIDYLSTLRVLRRNGLRLFFLSAMPLRSYYRLTSELVDQQCESTVRKHKQHSVIRMVEPLTRLPSI